MPTESMEYIQLIKLLNHFGPTSLVCQTVTFFIKAFSRYLGHKVVDSEGGLGMLFRRHGEAVDDVKGEVVLESDLLSVQQGPVVLDLGGNEII